MIRRNALCRAIPGKYIVSFEFFSKLVKVFNLVLLPLQRKATVRKRTANAQEGGSATKEGHFQ